MSSQLGSIIIVRNREMDNEHLPDSDECSGMDEHEEEDSVANNAMDDGSGDSD